MAYASYEHGGRRRVGRVDGDRVVPLTGLTELGRDTDADRLRTARELPGEAVGLGGVRLLPVVPNPARIVCVGLNYRAHVDETGRELPTYPVLFTKFASRLSGPHDPVELPRESGQVDYEGELAVVIGRRGRRISRADAPDHVLGYTVANDITMRDYQYKTHQWLQGKAWDRSTPLGPYLVTPSEVDLAGAGIRTTLRGEVVQSSTLDRLIFDVPTLIATVSEFTELEPGDLLLTGTPSGVGYRRDPQVFLAPGDEVTVEIDGVGVLSTTNRGEPAR
jgi:acylpyruvate hydrolase